MLSVLVWLHMVVAEGKNYQRFQFHDNNKNFTMLLGSYLVLLAQVEQSKTLTLNPECNI